MNCSDRVWICWLDAAERIDVIYLSLNRQFHSLAAVDMSLFISFFHTACVPAFNLHCSVSVGLFLHSVRLLDAFCEAFNSVCTRLFYLYDPLLEFKKQQQLKSLGTLLKLTVILILQIERES